MTPSRPHEALGPKGSHGRKLRVRCRTRLVKYLRADIWKLAARVCASRGQGGACILQQNHLGCTCPVIIDLERRAGEARGVGVAAATG